MATDETIKQFTTDDMAYYVELVTNVDVVVEVGDYLYRITGMRIEHDEKGYETRFIIETADQAFGSPTHAEVPADATLAPAGEDAGADGN